MSNNETPVYGTHVPVLLTEVIRLLESKEGDIAVDGTLGAGGYTEALLQTVGRSGKVISFDLDLEAIANAREKFQIEIGEDRLHLINSNFGEIRKELEQQDIDDVQAIVLDLGLSSHQLEAGRGFSFNEVDAPLDMRFGHGDASKRPAAELLNGLDEEELADLFYEYGELRNARVIARGVVQRRHQKAFSNVQDLIDVAEKTKKGQERREKYLAKVFQAIRIAVNDELSVLEQAIRDGIDALSEGGRIAIVSYHSLEDRIVKQIFQEETKGCICPPESPICRCGHTPRVTIKGKPVTPTEEEINTNPRARSARLRVAEKLPLQ